MMFNLIYCASISVRSHRTYPFILRTDICTDLNVYLCYLTFST